MKTYDYYCTWQAQNIFCQITNIQHRDYLDEKALFKEDGLVNAYPSFRENLYFVLDDGWDVPYTSTCKEDYPFASQIIKEERFPSFKGTPQEKLKQMVDKITSYGWKGVGIWICAQGSGKDYFKDSHHLKTFFKERLLWSKYAHISYWKVDWGNSCNEIYFRKMLTKLAHTLYPELIIENAMCINPVNGFHDGEEENLKYTYPWNKTMKKYTDQVCKISEVFRSYDVTEELSTVSTLARLAYLLKQPYSIINCEDELYMGAILGCALGIQRNKACIKANIAPKTSFHFRSNEALAALHYRKLVPAFTGGKIHVSKEIFKDKWQFEDYWCANIDHQLVFQLCPSRVARNTTLPKVKAILEVPYVICCQDFLNHYSIGTFKRLNYEDDNKYLVDIRATIHEKVTSIGIFSNHIQTLSLHMKEPIDIKHLYLTDLISNHKREITSYIQFKNNTLIIPYASLTQSFTCDDLSSKAFLVTFQ